MARPEAAGRRSWSGWAILASALALAVLGWLLFGVPEPVGRQPRLVSEPKLADRPMRVPEPVANPPQPCNPAEAAVAAPTGSARGSCLRHAAAFGLVQVVDEMIKAGADPATTDTDGNTALMLAAAAGKIDVVRRLLEIKRVQAQVAAVNAVGESALTMCLRRQRSEIADLLIAAGALRNADQRLRATIQSHAIRHCSPALFRALPPATTPPVAQPDAEAVPTFAAGRCDKATLGELRELTNPGGITSLLRDQAAILEASRLGNYWALELLLDQGVDPNTADEEGMTPLVEAAARLREPLVTPQGEATARDREAIVTLLIERGADINKSTFAKRDTGSGSQTVPNNTPLMLAAFTGNHSMVMALLSAPHLAVVNQRNASGHTALMIAAQEGYLDVVRLLLHPPRGPGADKELRNRRRETAADLAEAAGHQAIAKLLR